MSERKHTVRPPLVYDDADLLDLAYNPAQPRDAHGRWAKSPATKVEAIVDSPALALKKAFSVKPPKGSPAAAKQTWAVAAKQIGKITDAEIKPAAERVAKKAAAKEAVKAGRKVLLTRRGQFKDTPAARRHFRKITHEAQMEVFKEAGLHLNPKFKDMDTTDLMRAWAEPGHTFGDRQEMREEIDKRLKQLDIVAKSMDQSMTDFVRENRRDSLRRFDSKLRTLPGGRAVILLRERLIRDKMMDHMEGLREHFNEHGKAYAKHVLTAVAIASLLHPLGIVAVGGAAGAGLLPASSTEAFSTLMENLWVHSGLAVALDVPLRKFLEPVFKPFEREHRAKAAKKFEAKHQTRRLHV